MLGHFLLVCIGASIFVGGLALTFTGVGALFGIPMMAVGMGLVETHTPGGKRA
jgi:hypothetical protein